VQTHTRPVTQPHPTSPPETVLVVDDDHAICDLMALAVELGGRAPLKAGSAAEALALLDEHDVALVLTDVQMPRASGLELLAALSVTKRPPPVLVVTGETDAYTTRTAKLLGARKVIAKPFGLDELGCEIDEALAAQHIGRAGP
jgi:DNA-binding NtrC family response regulator